MSTNLTLTAREMEVLKAIGKYIQPSNVDWAKIADELNFKTPKAARDKWYPIRDKLFGAGGDSNGETPKKAAPTPRKRKAASEETPAKKKGKAKKAASEEQDDDDDSDDLGGFGGVKPEPKSDDEDLV